MNSSVIEMLMVNGVELEGYLSSRLMMWLLISEELG